MTSVFSGACLQKGLMDFLDPKPDPAWQDDNESVEEPKEGAPEAQNGIMAILDPKCDPAWQEDNPCSSEEPKAEKLEVSDAKIHKIRPALSIDALEVDYTKNCTPLYKKIENAIEDYEWEPIAKFLDTGHWPGTLFADEKGPKEQTMTWVTKFDNKDPTYVRWSQLPLHLAIVCGAPFSIVGRLIEHYPAGVRCTDDQRNLPIHLALRHGASDDVVTYLLMQFPESCNARGKDRRTPIQCAMRAPSKVRGKMLEIFVTKTKAKIRMELADAVGASAAALSDKEAQISDLQADLEAKTMALAELEGKLAALDHDATLEELKTQKLTQVMALEKKIEELETLNNNMLETERLSREKEASLLKDIEFVTKAITTAKSSSELDKIKDEVATVAMTRVETSKEELTKQIEAISSDLEANAKEMSEDELKELKASVEKLSNSTQKISSTEDIISLWAEADEIVASVKERGAIAQTKAELILLKKAVEEEIKVEGKSKEEKSTLRKALASLESVDKMSNKELLSLKLEIVESRKAAQRNDLMQKTQEDILLLSKQLEVVLKASEGDSKVELEASLEAIKKIQAELDNNKTTEELLAIKTEIDALKEAIKDKADTHVEEASFSSKTERSFRSTFTGSTRKRKAKSRIKKFLSKIMGKKKKEEKSSKDALTEEEGLILPPCLSEAEPVPVLGKAPSASFEMPAEHTVEHTDTETDEEHPVEENPQVSTSPSLMTEKSTKSKASAKSLKSTKSKKSTQSKKSTKSSKSKKSTRSFRSSKSKEATGEVQIDEQSARATAVSL